MNTLKIYYKLTKPGIIMGNGITAAAGFLLASQVGFDPLLFVATLVGLSLIIASGCVFNNYIDRIADTKMERTKRRPLATNAVSTRSALIFATLLACSGLLLLFSYTNLLTLLIAFSGLIIYASWYSYWKYRTSHATLIGSLAGAVPIVVGYCAVTNQINTGALILFLIVILWQMPHFFAIALYRMEDYARASIPVLPLTRGIKRTKIEILLYSIAFTAASLMLTFCGYTGYLYLATATIVGVLWITLAARGFKSTNHHRWAHQMFRFSLIAITLLCILMASDRLIRPV